MPLTFTEEDFREPLTFTEADFQEVKRLATPGLPRLAETEQKISQREPYFAGLKRTLTKQPAYVEESLAQGKIPAIEHPFRTALDIATIIPRKFVSVPLSMLTSGARLAEGTVASAGLALQRGKPEEIFPDIAKTFRGERQAEIGDIFRTTGVPEPIAATGGLLATIGLAKPGATLKSTKGIITSPVKTAAKAGEEISGISKGIAKPFQAIGKKIGQTFEVLKGPNQAQIKANIGRIKSEIDVLRGTARGAKLDISSQQLAEQKVLQGQLTTIRTTFANNAKMLSRNFNEAKNKGIAEVRNLLRKSNSALSQNYRQGLDAAEDALVARGQQMTKGELDDILNKVFIKANEGALPASRNVQAMENLASRFGIEHTVDDLGNVIAKNADEVISFKTLVAEVKTLNKGLSGKFRQGVGATPDDIILDLFHDEYGKWIAQKSPEFAIMQAEYAPIAAIKNEANKIFKPYDFAEIKTNQAANLLRRFGLAKEGDKQAEKNLLKAIEKGYEFQGKKIGGQKGIFTDIETLGKQLNDLGEQKAVLTDSIKQRLNSMKFSNSAEKINIEKEVLAKIDKLTANKLTENIKLQTRADADRIADILIKFTLGAVGLGTAGGVLRAFGRQRE